LDRITRNSIIEAQALFMLIIRAGIILVTFWISADTRWRASTPIPPTLSFRSS
jgi:hypothetical protein